MRQLAVHIAIVRAKACEYPGSSLRGNDWQLPGSGTWETRMA